MKKQFLPLAMSGVLSLSACAPNKETVRDVIKKDAPADSEHGKAAATNTFLPFWERVAAGANPNPALAQLLVPYLTQQDIEKYQELDFVSDPAIIKIMQADRELAKRMFMLRELPFGNDQMILNNSLTYRYNTHSFSAKNISDGFNLSLQIERQNRAMEQVLTAYTQRAQTIAAELAPAMVARLRSEDQKRLERLALEDRARAVEEIVEILKGYDRVLAAYNFHDEDNTKLIVVGMIAGAIYEQLAKDPHIQTLIGQAKDIVSLANKVREVAALVQVVQDNKKKVMQDWTAARSAMDGIVNSIRKSKFEIELHAETRVETLRFMSDALTGNLQVGEGAGLLSEPQIMNKNIETFVNSAASAAGRLDNILNATEKIAATLGVELDPGVKNAIESARMVTSAVNLAQSVMSAYASEGMIGALGMIAGGPGPALLGVAAGNAMQAEMAADLKAIKKEVAEIKRLQKQVIEMQAETMKMVRDIAVMVEAYHVEEMNELRSIKSLVVQQIEAQRLVLHSEINACEKMIQYGVSMTADRTQPYKLGSLRTSDVTKHLLKASLMHKGALAKFARSSGETLYETCQKSMTKAFGDATAEENPVQILANLKPDDLSNFYSDIYLPLLDTLEDRKSHNHSIYMAGLHIPALNFAGLSRKIDYAKRSWPTMDGRSYDLKNMISTEGLERYVESLLVLHPILSYDKADLLAVAQDANILSQRYETSWQRSNYWLRNALFLTQSAIAQEGMMAGESLLEGLGQQWRNVTTKTNCALMNPQHKLACAVRANSLLTKNLLKFVIHQRANAQVLRTSYSEALTRKDIKALELLLGSDFAGKLRLHTAKNPDGTVKEDYVVLSWMDERGSYHTRLPAAAEVMAGEIEYTGNMKRLLLLQDKIVEALLEVTPMSVDEGISKQARRLLLQN